MSTVETTLTELRAFRIKVEEGLEGFRFLDAGNRNEPDIHEPLLDIVTVYDDLLKRTETAIAALEALVEKGYDLLPKFEAPKSLLDNIDEDIRKAAFARQQAIAFIQAVSGHIVEVES